MFSTVDISCSLFFRAIFIPSFLIFFLLRFCLRPSIRSHNTYTLAYSHGLRFDNHKVHACGALSSDTDWTGAVVVARRGTCTFTTKARTAAAAGAAALVLVNTEDGNDHLAGPDAHGIPLSVNSADANTWTPYQSSSVHRTFYTPFRHLSFLASF